MFEYRVLVCGGRKYDDKQTVHVQLMALARKHRRLTVAAGGARGADTLAKRWCEVARIPFVEYAVNIKIDGPWPGAGPNRNRRMYDDFKPDMILAFPGGSGTRNMKSINPRIVVAVQPSTAWLLSKYRDEQVPR